ncbi:MULTISPECIES: ABC transporter permease [Xanthobacteraceae]|uniref:Polar amino acid transport system permease protein/octopine/nopaline transport system permease protein n=1 Tax=Labrys monachus TaxID=217067 RepID=A0ABU0FHD2_9HYPH|nr:MULTISPECIES: ABC transporter permease subunit [Xanthobacteraceae]MBS7538226.1 ABC transporter permease subunit [Ancylobacter lacus]MDQ0393528.1 polar amino acid transport system permease protein/octopine/nopaline transport system permease protein [Labrys monachus]
MSFDLLLPAFSAILSGLFLTLLITICGFALGQAIALPVALALVSTRVWLSVPAAFYTFVVRGSPLLIQLFIIYYGLGQLEFIRESFLWPVLRSAVYCAILAIALNSAAYSARVVAGAIRQLHKGQFEAGHALGLTDHAILSKVVLPQVYRVVLPAIGNELVLVMKASTLASAVTVIEMTGAARLFVARTYAPFEAFLIAGILYLVFGALFGWTFKIIEARVAIPGR